MSRRVAIANDHAGLALKHALAAMLRDAGFDLHDLGTDDDASVDYPDYGRKLAQDVAANPGSVGIAICGSGIGISIAANRVPGIRAALCRDVEDARLARLHNDANIIAFGARRTSADTAKDCLLVFLETPFEGGRHAPRVHKLG